MEKSNWQPEIGEEVVVAAPKEGYHNIFDPGTIGVVTSSFTSWDSVVKDSAEVFRVKVEGIAKVGSYYSRELSQLSLAYTPSQEGDRDDDV